MSIRITEKSKKGGRVPKEAQYVIAASPPVPRGGLRPNGNGRSNNNGKKKKVKNGKLKRTNGLSRRGRLEVLNAFGKQCLGLPRAVGDYTYVTTIDNVTVQGTGTEQLWCFTPSVFHYSVGALGENVGSQGLNFTSFFAYSSENGGIGAGTVAGIRFYNSKAIADAMVGGTEMVPAAYSVRITCPTALQTAKGQYFLGKWNIAADPREYSTYQDIADGFMSYGQPRPLTAARLAMRGVQCNAMPRNMADCSDFLHVSANSGPAIQNVTPYPLRETTGTWSGLSPIFLIVESSTDGTTSLNVQVAIKWRYRFPMTNPAAKTHTYQGIGTDAYWNDVCRDASGLGHAVEAIPEGIDALI